jgi:hypothetical protein
LADLKQFFFYDEKLDFEDATNNEKVIKGDASHITGHDVTKLSDSLKSKSIQFDPNLSSSKGPNRKRTDSKTDKTDDAKRGRKAATSSQLKAFLKGASAAQQTQIQMIYRVFEIMDADRDGVLSVSDVRSYFRSIGRLSDDVTVKKWIRNRDIDQSGTVSLPEFVASFAHQLDPASKPSGPFAVRGSTNAVAAVSAITSAFGALRLGNSPPEVVIAVEAAEEYVRRALDSPSTDAFWRISVRDSSFNQKIGRLFGGIKLMHALGFSDEQNGTVLVLRDPEGSKWVTIPEEVRRVLLRNLEELSMHRQSLNEMSISHIAAGTFLNVHVFFLNAVPVAVSSAIEMQGDSVENCSEWGIALEAISTILGNILKHPGDPKYYRINTSNPNFQRRLVLLLCNTHQYLFLFHVIASAE